MRTEALTVALLLLLAGCQDKAPAPAPVLAVPPEVAKTEQLLAASSERAYGVVLPVGLEHTYDRGESKVYRSDDDTARVLAFFAARYPEAPVEVVGEGGVLRELRVIKEGEAQRVEISVLARSSGGARVSVTRLPSAHPAGADADLSALVRLD